MGPIGVAIIVVLGIFVPFIVIVVMPIRVVFILVSGKWITKLLFVSLLIPWWHYLQPILEHGYVSKKPYWEGPTVDPLVWKNIAIAWAIGEFIHRALTLSDKHSRKASKSNEPQ